MSTNLDDLLNLRTDLEHDQDRLWAERHENRAKGVELDQEIQGLPEGSKREGLQAAYDKTTARDREIEAEIADKDRQLAALDKRIDQEEQKKREIDQLMAFMGGGPDRGIPR